MKTVLSTLISIQPTNNRKLGVVTAVFLVMSVNVLAAATFVNGLVPDWNQPYRYTAASPNGGPGPDPAPGIANQWNDWCAPTSGANLAGHWTDVLGVPVADTVAYPGSTVLWAAGPSWQDYLADGTLNRPLFPAGILPAQTTDIGWYMDANYGFPYAAGKTMGGYPFGDPPHFGTYLKDIHAGLQIFLNSRYSLSGGVYWLTGTRGKVFFAGTDTTRATILAPHPTLASAFGEVMNEINNNRTLIASFAFWNLNPAAVPPLGSVGPANTESYYGGTYYTWATTAGPTNAEDEAWNYDDTGSGLGHAVTVVGYIQAGDPDDKGPTPQLNLGPTDWVIVHDNWSSTPRNVIIPYGYLNQGVQGWDSRWIANTTAKPWPTQAKYVKGVVPDWNQPYQYNAQSPNAGPGADPFPFAPSQWNDWCAPCSGANLAGHWTDHHGAPVADTTPYTGSTVGWALGQSWQDYLADWTGNFRPIPQFIPGGPLPAPTTDIGWYMDCNRMVAWDAGGGVMGGFNYGNGVHVGTYLKDIGPGLQTFLNSRYTVAGGGWDIGTEGRTYAAGMSPTGGVAQMLLDPVSSFNAVKSEIDRDHTLIVSFLHWNIAATATPSLPLVRTNTESDFGGTYYQWVFPPPAPGVTNAEDEEWNMYPGDLGLGHAVTAVGYIPQGDVLDPGPGLGLGPTDWVIVHDNWFSTPRNVIIPFDFIDGMGNQNWVANTYAFPDPGFLQLTNIVVVNKTNAVVSLTGIPSYRHDLLANTNLAMTNGWSTAVSNVAFAAGTMWITNTVPTGDPQRFYRIRASY
ncbi:MAG TPA: hypothetical protein VN784_07460 [Candidatus Limnocylindrales bacterium]|nr:hypothetical protein [Candidatus Limnocylindrales bacterium]